MSTATYLRSRVDPSPGTLGLLLGDALAIVAFASVGVSHHGGDPVGDPVNVAWAAAPLFAGWVLAAVLGGLYTRDALATPRRALSWALPAWVVATLVGHLLRSTDAVPGGTALSFVLVTLGFGAIFVVGWRVAAAVLVRRI